MLSWLSALKGLGKPDKVAAASHTDSCSVLVLKMKVVLTKDHLLTRKLHDLGGREGGMMLKITLPVKGGLRYTEAPRYVKSLEQNRK